MKTLIPITTAICIALIDVSVGANAANLESLEALSPNKKFHGQWSRKGRIGPVQIELKGGGKLKLVTGDCNGTKFAGNSSIRITEFELVEQALDSLIFEASTTEGKRRDTYTLIDGGMFHVDYTVGGVPGTITKIAKYGLDNPGQMCQP